MARKLDLSSFETEFQRGNDFEVTEAQYNERVQKTMPQTHYLRTNSPVAMLAREYGYTMQVEERIQRIIVFTKEGTN